MHTHMHREKGVVTSAGGRPLSFINITQGGRDAFHVSEYTGNPWGLLNRLQAEAPGAQAESLGLATNGEEPLTGFRAAFFCTGGETHPAAAKTITPGGGSWASVPMCWVPMQPASDDKPAGSEQPRGSHSLVILLVHTAFQR